MSEIFSNVITLIALYILIALYYTITRLILMPNINCEILMAIPLGMYRLNNEILRN